MMTLSSQLTHLIPVLQLGAALLLLLSPTLFSLLFTARYLQVKNQA